MTFAAPLYLIALLPWAGVVLYLLWGRRRRTSVPFLELWRVEVEGRPVRRRASPPPVALAFAILAMLLAILAAGRPRVYLPGPGTGPDFTIVLDRGFTMSARGEGDLRFREAAAEAQGAILATFGPVHPFAVAVVPAAPPAEHPRRTDASDWTAYQTLAPTAADTRHELRAVVRARLAETEQPVIVLTDQTLGIDDRLIQIPPASPVRNAGIVHVAARERPSAQVMIRVRNTGLPPGPATVRVTSDDRSAEQTITLPPAGEVDAFIGLPRLGPTVRAELLVSDDQPADNVAWLARQAGWPRVEARVPLPPAVRRMLEIYRASRPPGEASPRVMIVDDPRQVPAGEPALVLNREAPAAPATRPAEAVRVRAHPVTESIDWPKLMAAVPLGAPSPPPEGWEPVVGEAGAAWVAVREAPARQVWVGFPQTGPWTGREEFVYFWANLLNWLGDGGETYASTPVGPVEGQWTPAEGPATASGRSPAMWPGLYRDSQGVLRAFNAPDVPAEPPQVKPWRERLAAYRSTARRGVGLAPGLLCAATACVLVAALTWKREERRALARAGRSGPVASPLRRGPAQP